MKRRRKRGNPLTRAETAKVLEYAHHLAKMERQARSIGDIRERLSALGHTRGAIDTYLGVASEFGGRRWWTYRPIRKAAYGRRGAGIRFYREKVGSRKNPHPRGRLKKYGWTSRRHLGWARRYEEQATTTTRPGMAKDYLAAASGHRAWALERRPKLPAKRRKRRSKR